MSTVAKKVLMGSGAVAEPLEIEQSILFDETASLVRTPSSTGNRKKWTISVWVKRAKLGALQYIYGGQSTNETDLRFSGTDTIEYFGYQSGALTWGWGTTRVFRDVGAWYHIVAIFDSANSTQALRARLFVNGEEQSENGATSTAVSLNQDSMMNLAGTPQYIGRLFSTGSPYYYSGYMAEFHFLDGAATVASNFGETNSDTGQWIPKEYTGGSYGTNGFYLKFVSGAIGTDSSGNSNTMTVANLANSDVVIDTPTNNFATLNPIPAATSGMVLGQGNLYAETRASAIANAQQAVSTIAMPVGSGKWYWEMRNTYTSLGFLLGITPTSEDPILGDTGNLGYNQYNASGGKQYATETRTSYGTAWYTSGQTYIISCYYDSDNGKIGFYLNGTDQGFAFTNVVASTYFASFRCGSGGTGTFPTAINFGQNGTFGGAVTAQGNADTNGIGDFYYAPPSGYKALCTANLPAPAIPLPSAQFNTVLYTGNGGTQSISGVGHQPDWVWIKNRAAADNHVLTDAVRGATIQSGSNLTGAEVTNDDGLTAFASDGFAIGDDVEVNTNSEAYVSWNWKANGSGSTNTVGSLDAVVSANAAAGFSIATWTGNGSAQSIGHGLSKDLEFLVVKNRDANASWVVQVSTTVNDYMYLNSTAEIKQTSLFGLDITRSNDGTFYYGGPAYMGANGVDYLAYCFHSIEGYSKIGRYTGNGSADGPFVNCGFKPAWLMVKNITAAADWMIWDTKRNPFNEITRFLYPNLSADDGAGSNVLDLVSNGFKLRNAGTRNRNYNGDVYLFMAFADSPFKTATAR